MRVKMMCKTTLLLVKATVMLASCLTVLSVVRPANAQTYTNDAAGVRDGRIWTLYILDSSTGSVSITPGANGNYRGSWSNFKGNFTMGVGWSGNDHPFYYPSTVNANAINYVGYNIGSYTDDKVGSMSVYGFVNANSTNPLMEFYIVERWNPAYTLPGEGTKMNTSPVTIGAGSYNIYRVPKSGFVQYWSVRTSQAPLGQNITVPVTQHFAEWEKLNMKSSKSRRFMYLSTESLSQRGGVSNGSVAATVWGWQ